MIVVGETAEKLLEIAIITRIRHSEHSGYHINGYIIDSNIRFPLKEGMTTHFVAYQNPKLVKIEGGYRRLPITEDDELILDFHCRSNYKNKKRIMNLLNE